MEEYNVNIFGGEGWKERIANCLEYRNNKQQNLSNFSHMYKHIPFALVLVRAGYSRQNILLVKMLNLPGVKTNG